MQLLIRSGIIKSVLLIFLFPSIAFGADLSTYFKSAKSGKLSISELIDVIVLKAIESPAIAADVNRHKHLVPGLADVAAPALLSKIHQLLLDGKIDDSWAVKTIADSLLPAAWPESTRISQIFSVISKLDAISQKRDTVGLCSLDFSVLGKEDLEVIERVNRQVAQTFIDQAVADSDAFNGIRKLAELTICFTDLEVRDRGVELLATLATKQDLQSSKWSFDLPAVQQFISDLLSHNPQSKQSLIKLYSWKTIQSQKEKNENRASIYYNWITPLLSDEEKDLLRKEIINVGFEVGFSKFSSARADELKAVDKLSLFEHVKLMLYGYYGWIPLALPLGFVFLLFLLKSKSKKVEKKKPYVQRQVEDDEYTKLLKKLNLDENASEGQIKKAFRQMVKEHHPDAHGTDGVVLDSEGKVDKKFEELRKTYDRILEIRKSWFGTSK